MVRGYLELALGACLLATAPSQAQTVKKSQAGTSPDRAEVKPKIAAQAKARSKALKAQKANPASNEKIDLNGATKEQLTKLPGITEAYADKIIAGRPYLTKAHLVTHNVLPHGVYTAIKGLVVAKQPR